MKTKKMPDLHTCQERYSQQSLPSGEQTTHEASLHDVIELTDAELEAIYGGEDPSGGLMPSCPPMPQMCPTPRSIMACPPKSPFPCKPAKSPFPCKPMKTPPPGCRPW
jgi:hypothetical protein